MNSGSNYERGKLGYRKLHAKTQDHSIWAQCGCRDMHAKVDWPTLIVFYTAEEIQVCILVSSKRVFSSTCAFTHKFKKVHWFEISLSSADATLLSLEKWTLLLPTKELYPWGTGTSVGKDKHGLSIGSVKVKHERNAIMQHRASHVPVFKLHPVQLPIEPPLPVHTTTQPQWCHNVVGYDEGCHVARQPITSSVQFFCLFMELYY